MTPQTGLAGISAGPVEGVRVAPASAVGRSRASDPGRIVRRLVDLETLLSQLLAAFTPTTRHLWLDGVDPRLQA